MFVMYPPFFTFEPSTHRTAFLPASCSPKIALLKECMVPSRVPFYKLRTPPECGQPGV